MFSFSSCTLCGFGSYTVYRTVPRENFSGSTWKVRYMNQIRTRYRNWRTTLATLLQPSKSIRYIGYTSTCLDVRSCVLMQEKTICNIFCDGTSFQHLATAFISVCTLSYGTGLLFRGPLCIRTNYLHKKKGKLIKQCQKKKPFRSTFTWHKTWPYR